MGEAIRISKCQKLLASPIIHFMLHLSWDVLLSSKMWRIYLVFTILSCVVPDIVAKHAGFCLAPDGTDQNDGQVLLATPIGDTIEEKKADCLKRCKAHPEAK